MFRRNVIVINLKDDVERRALRYATQCGLREIAGPGSDSLYKQMEKWRNKTAKYNRLKGGGT